MVSGVSAGLVGSLDERPVLRRAADVARPLEWPMVVFEVADAALWRIVEGFVG